MSSIEDHLGEIPKDRDIVVYLKQMVRDEAERGFG
jgi:hypothetical protein